MALQKQLDTFYTVTGTILFLQVDTFSFDLKSSLIHLGYSALSSESYKYQTDIPITLAEPEYSAFKARLDVLEQTMSATDALDLTCLEYTPKAGALVKNSFGIWHKVLDTPYDVSGTIKGQEVDGFAINAPENLIQIAYSTLENLTKVNQSDLPYILLGDEYTNFKARYDVVAQTKTASQALIQTCLEFLPGSGTIA